MKYKSNKIVQYWACYIIIVRVLLELFLAVVYVQLVLRLFEAVLFPFVS